MPVLQTLFADIPTSVPNELFQPLLEAPNIRIERIVSHGHASPEGFWDDQDTDERVLLISGATRLVFESEEPVEMTAGSFIHIPAHKRHRVDWTDPEQPTIWLAIHYSVSAKVRRDILDATE